MTRSSTLRFGTAAAAVAMAALLAACGSSGGDQADSTTTTAASTTTADAGTTTSTTDGTTSTSSAAGGTTSTTLSSEGVDTETTKLETLPDGKHYGYIAGIENGTVEGQAVQVIIFDKVDFLTGADAVAAAHEDGAIPADQDFVDNDYYIRNQNQTVRRLAVVPDATVTSLSGGSPDPVPSSVTEVAKTDFLYKIDVGNVRGITTVSSIEGVFLP
ncbi:hypothetical protein [Aquihabitans sp. McL0605]|uniref:hypothetical protein n=1 Tax=Aquihabitans sp. McL0605 TaxID=3415671 RepID=UPI003CF23C8B